jgi:lipoprotein-anchoring transpeptidase ErfK/SrfK
LALGVGLTVTLGVVLGVRLSTSGPHAVPDRLGSVVATPAPVLRITPAADTAVNPRTPIVVRVAAGILATVTVTDTRTGERLPGTRSPDGTHWISGSLRYASTYRIEATARGTTGAPIQASSTLTTIVPTAQAYPSLVPAPAPERTFGVGQVLGVSFDHDITDRAAAEKALSVQSRPAQPGSWYWMDNRTAHYRPQRYWQPHTTITVRAALFGVDVGHGVYGRTDRSATYTVGDSWIARADGATDKMQIFHNGALVNTMDMSLGSPGFPSHSGPHVISDKKPSIIMDSCTYGVCRGQRGYYRERVALDERISNDGEFVHSAPWSVGQQGNSNVSHGCVNLSPANAQWFYDHFGLGDVVEITHSGGPPLPVWDTYGDWTLPWNAWATGSALHP